MYLLVFCMDEMKSRQKFFLYKIKKIIKLENEI